MARRIYTEQDQARIAVLLQASVTSENPRGNIKRVARETGLATTTLRQWRDKWEKEGYPEAIEEALPQAREDVILDLKDVIALSVNRLKEMLKDPKAKISAKDLAWITGIFTDKVRVIEGHAISRTETVHALPSPEEYREKFRGFFAEIVQAAEIRQAEVIDAGLAAEIKEAEEAEFTPISPLGLPASELKE